ncbi:MAG: hypothetical protein KIT33_12735 [Candidatus Kapabacteria bacterium]|nr:hypothetical protein [Ignavibacteriota bacterium]MCW5885827.1 hypothetical protein [Candidatus Kapabacteria bacterium]
MKINYIILLIISILFLQTLDSKSQLSKEQLKVLMPSESRFVTDLSGNWERTENMRDWTSVRIPLSEQIDEKVIYKRFVKIPAEMVDNFSWQLYFLGIDHNVEVFWNEQFIGKYVGSLVPFNVRIPDNTVRNETNEIRLVITPATSKIKQIRNQHLNARREFSGIIREVLLFGTPQAWISDIRHNVKLKGQNSADIQVKVSLSTAEIKALINKLKVKDSISVASNDKIKLSIMSELRKQGSGDLIQISSEKSITLESERTIDDEIAMPVSGINLWSPETPDLYYLTVKLKRGDLTIDDYTVPIGFRSLKTAMDGENSILLLNGQNFKLKGVSYVEDYKDLGQSLTVSKIIQDIELIKKLGANTVRAKFNTPHPFFVHLCNSNGLMIMLELPIYDVPSSLINLDEIKVYNQNLAKQYVSKFDINPSVIAWGVGEGVDESTEHYKNFSESILKLFAKDSDKLKYKILPHGISKVHTEGFDFIGYSDIRQNVDFNQINYEFKRIQSIIDNKPLFMAFGTEIQINNHNGYSDPLSLEFQAYNILNSFKIVEKNNGIGCIVNTYNDYLQNKPSLTTNNDLQYIQTSGLVDRNRLERLSFSTLQALFNKEKEPLLNAGSHTRSSPPIYLIFGILLAILLVFLINRFKRFREYMFRSILRPYNFYSDIRDQRIISSIQTILLGVILSSTVGIFLSSILFYYKDSEVLEYFLMILLPSNSIKEFVYSLIWMPELSFIFITIVSYMLAFITAWIIRVFAVLSRARVYWNDCLTISIWAALPAVILLPISIVLIRLLVASPATIWLFLLLYATTSIWTVARLLKSISVVFDIPVMRSYIIGFVIMFISIAAPLGYYHVKYSFFAYSSYFFEVLLSN